MGQHNLKTVIGFEFIRTITKARFWIGTLSVPVIMAIVFGLIFASGTATEAASNAQESAEITLTYTDASGLITPEQAAAFGATPATSPQAGIEAVRNGEIETYFEFPADPASTEVKAYGEDQGLFENNNYSAVAKAMLNEAVNARVGSDSLATLAAGDAAVEVTTFKDGKETGGFTRPCPHCCSLLSSTP